MISVIDVGGKQYCIAPNQRLIVNRLKHNVGETVTFSDLLSSHTVTAEVLEHGLSKKVTTRKFRNKTRYHKFKGHRQPITILRFQLSDTTAPVKKAVKSTPKVESNLSV